MARALTPQSHTVREAVEAFRPGAAPDTAARRRLAPRDLWLLLAACLLLALAWQLALVLLLVFAAGLLALVLRLCSAALQRVLHLRPRVALALVIAMLVLLLGGGGWLAGASMAQEVQTLRDTLPQALQALREWLSSHAPGRWLLDLWGTSRFALEDLPGLAGVASDTLNAVVGALGALGLLVALAIYAAADPATYRRGLMRLVPPARRARVERALDAATHDLSRWLLGQGVSMLSVGLLTGIGLALIGMPLALSLGVIAAVLEFVPYFGPILLAFLVVGVALTEGQTLALWALAVCIAVQQTESYVVQPLAQKWAVRLPPVLALLAFLIFGLLFGLPGVLLAVPLMVLTVTLVDQLVVRSPEPEANGSVAPLQRPLPGR